MSSLCRYQILVLRNLLQCFLFLGLFGVDRFLLGDIKMGIIKLMTFGGLLVLWAIDLFTINKRTKIYNLNKVNSILNKGVMNEKHE